MISDNRFSLLTENNFQPPPFIPPVYLHIGDLLDHSVLRLALLRVKKRQQTLHYCGKKLKKVTSQYSLVLLIKAIKN